MNAVREERGPQACPDQPGDDGAQLLARPQRRLAARDLHIGPRAIAPRDVVDAAVKLLERQIPDRLRAFRQIAERAVEIAPLGDFQRDAADRRGPTDELHAVHARSAGKRDQRFGDCAHAAALHIGRLHRCLVDLVLALHPRAEEAGLLRAVHIPGVCRDEREARGFDTDRARGVQVDLAARLPAPHFVDRDYALDERSEMRALEQLLRVLPAAVGECDDAYSRGLQPLEPRGDIRMRRQLGEAREHALDLACSAATPWFAITTARLPVATSLNGLNAPLASSAKASRSIWAKKRRSAVSGSPADLKRAPSGSRAKTVSMMSSAIACGRFMIASEKS